MTKEDINLFIYDICSKIPYGLICSIYRIDDEGVGWRDGKCNGFYRNKDVYEFYFDDIISVDDISYIKPYLRPMSSMTLEEKEELKSLKFIYSDGHITNESIEFDKEYNILVDEVHCSFIINWLNKHHFDYNNLIIKNIALKAPEGMY